MADYIAARMAQVLIIIAFVMGMISLVQEML